MNRELPKPTEVDLAYFHEFCRTVAEQCEYLPNRWTVHDATLAIKSGVLAYLPTEYVIDLPMDAGDRWRCGGRFDFTRPVPWEVFEQAARAAGIDIGESDA